MHGKGAAADARAHAPLRRSRQSPAQGGLKEVGLYTPIRSHAEAAPHEEGLTHPPLTRPYESSIPKRPSPRASTTRIPIAAPPKRVPPYPRAASSRRS